MVKKGSINPPSSQLRGAEDLLLPSCSRTRRGCLSPLVLNFKALGILTLPLPLSPWCPAPTPFFNMALPCSPTPPHPTPQIFPRESPSLLPSFSSVLLLFKTPWVLTTGDPRVITPVSRAFPLCHLLQHQGSAPPASQSPLEFPPAPTRHCPPPRSAEGRDLPSLCLVSQHPSGELQRNLYITWNTLASDTCSALPGLCFFRILGSSGKSSPWTEQTLRAERRYVLLRAGLRERGCPKRNPAWPRSYKCPPKLEPPVTSSGPSMFPAVLPNGGPSVRQCEGQLCRPGSPKPRGSMY